MEFKEFLEEHPEAFIKLQDWCREIFIKNLVGMSEEVKENTIGQFNNTFVKTIDGIYDANPSYLFYFFDEVTNFKLSITISKNNLFNYSINSEKFPVQAVKRKLAQQGAVKQGLELIEAQSADKKKTESTEKQHGSK